MMISKSRRGSKAHVSEPEGEKKVNRKINEKAEKN